RSETFAIAGIPQPPTAEALQTFCLGDFAPQGPSLADLEVSAHGSVLFYATAGDMDILPLDTPLVDGEDYFISNIDPDNNCEGSDRIRVLVALSGPEAPLVLDGAPEFCATENPTIAHLGASVQGPGDILWFESASGGSPLAGTEALIDAKSYFAATLEGPCPSADRVEVVPRVHAVPPVELLLPGLELCGLDLPVVADLGAALGEGNYTVLWYESPEGGTPLGDSVPLVQDRVYYAQAQDPGTGCGNPVRAMLTVDLSQCEPLDHGFFVPDGFSPNGDGRNDSFFV